MPAIGIGPPDGWLGALPGTRARDWPAKHSHLENTMVKWRATLLASERHEFRNPGAKKAILQASFVNAYYFGALRISCVSTRPRELHEPNSSPHE